MAHGLYELTESGLDVLLYYTDVELPHLLGNEVYRRGVHMLGRREYAVVQYKDQTVGVYTVNGAVRIEPEPEIPEPPEERVEDGVGLELEYEERLTQVQIEEALEAAKPVRE